MPVYRYSDASILDEVEIITNEQGGARAYLHARDGVPFRQLGDIQERLRSKGWFGVPGQRNGKPVLEVRGFTKRNELLAYLKSGNLIKEQASVASTKDDHQSFADKFRNGTLKISGIAYIFGDSAFMTYAGMELREHYKGLSKAAGDAAKIAVAKESVKGGWFKIVSGIGYAIGSIILAAYGSRDQSHIEIKKSVQKIDHFIKQEGLAGVNNGQVLTQEPEKKNETIFGKFNAWLRRYPSEALNIIYTAVGLALMRSSFQQINSMTSKIKPLQSGPMTQELQNLLKDRRTEMIDVGLGSVTASSALAGILIKEKKSLEGEKKRGGLLGVWDWIQEKPLRATGYGYMLATGFHAVATAEKWKRKPGETLVELNSKRKIIFGRGVFVAANVLAEILLVLSSKGHGEGVRNKDVDDSVIASTAEFIVKQKPEQREALVERLAGYMASTEVLGTKAETIASALRTQVDALSSNPWIKIPGKKKSQDAITVPVPAQEIKTNPATPASTIKVTGAMRAPALEPQLSPAAGIHG